ncbi:MAG: Gldg family protein [Planctomycetes bacterium]|nr:Gldg family protein [Planctomycetota bacterium]
MKNGVIESRTFLEESAAVFRAPVLLVLSLVLVIVLGALTSVTGDLLDRVLVAFSAAAAARYESALAGNFRNLIALGLWFGVLLLFARQARGWFGVDRGAHMDRRAMRLFSLGLGVVLLALAVLFPRAWGLVPLKVPLALAVLVGVIHIVAATRIPAIALRELSALLVNPLGYVVLTVFAVVLALLFFGALERLAAADATSELNIAPLTAFLGAAGAESRELNFLVIALLLVVPVITMRLIAEERRSGTEEVLLTTPVREWHVILGKFAGTFLFYLLLWALALVPLYLLGRVGHLDGWQVLSSLFGLAVIGFGLLGVGLLASAVTRNQLAAAVLTFLGMLLFTFQSFTKLPEPGGELSWLRDAALYLDLRQHLAWVARGTIDSRTVFLFLSLGVFTLFLAVRALETRRWAGFSLVRQLTAAKTVLAVLGLVAVVAAVVAVGWLTGGAQVREQRAAWQATVAAAAQADAEARAAARGKTARPEELFPEEPAAPPPAAGEQPGVAAPLEEDAGSETTTAAPAEKPQDDGKADAEKEAPAAEAGEQPPTQAPPAALDTPPAAGTEAPPEFAARWTPRRLLWVVGAALVLLMAYLALFARWLSGGLRNQIVFGSNVVVGSLAALTLAVLTNYLATRNHKALDVTAGRIYSLAPPVLAAVDGALREGESVDVIALVGRYPNPDTREKSDDNVRRDVLERVFQKFAEALNRPGVRRFQHEFVDTEPDSKNAAALERLKQVVSEYGATARDVIVRYRNRHEILSHKALFDMVVSPARFEQFLETWRERLRRGGMAPPLPPTRAEQLRIAELWLAETGSPDYLRTARARDEMEKTVADTIVGLVESPGNNLYFTVGHGEKKLDIRRKAADLQRNFGEATVFRQTLVRSNFNLTPLAPLTGDRTIPERCRYLLIAGPTQPFAAAEIEKIAAFVHAGGHLLVFTEAGQKSGLEPLLRKFRIRVDPSQIWLARSPGPGRMGMGQLEPWYPYIPIEKFPDRHPISQALAALSDAPESSSMQMMRSFPTLIMLLASPLETLAESDLDEKERAAAMEWKVTPVLEAGIVGPPGPQMLMPYAETELDQFRPTKDPAEKMGPFDVAVIAEPADDKLAGQRGKVVVVADTDFIEDRIQFPESWAARPGDASTYGVYDNELFVRQVLHYLKKRPSRIEATIVPPTPFDGNFQSPWVRHAKWVLWLALPALFLALGLFVFTVRRRA